MLRNLGPAARSHPICRSKRDKMREQGDKSVTRPLTEPSGKTGNGVGNRPNRAWRRRLQGSVTGRFPV